MRVHVLCNLVMPRVAVSHPQNVLSENSPEDQVLGNIKKEVKEEEEDENESGLTSWIDVYHHDIKEETEFDPQTMEAKQDSQDDNDEEPYKDEDESCEDDNDEGEDAVDDDLLAARKKKRQEYDKRRLKRSKRKLPDVKTSEKKGLDDAE